MKRHLYNFYINALPFVLSLLPTVVAIPIYLKELGAYNLGIYYLYLSLISIGGAFDLGISQTIIKYISEYKHKSPNYVFSIIRSSRIILFLALIASLGIAICLFFALLFMNTNISSLIFAIFFVGFAIQFLLNFELGILKGYELFNRVAFYEAIQKNRIYDNRNCNCNFFLKV